MILKGLNTINFIIGIIILIANLVVFPLFKNWKPELWLTFIGILLIVIPLINRYRKSKNSN